MSHQKSFESSSDLLTRMPLLKVSNLDARRHWREVVSLENFNKLMQGDVARNITKFWNNTKDLAPPALSSLQPYDEQELLNRKHLSKISGNSPSKVQPSTVQKQKSLLVVSGDNTGGSGHLDMEKMDSESKVMSDNDSINVPSKKEDSTHTDMNQGVPKLTEIKNMSLQEVNQIDSEDRLQQTSDRDRGRHAHQISEPMSETMVQEHGFSPNDRMTGQPSSNVLGDLDTDKDEIPADVDEKRTQPNGL